MDDNIRNDLFYVCSLIEFIGRKTKNSRAVIAESLGKDGLAKQMHDASVNHCLSFEQVSDEVIEYYKITHGDFDTISNCKYKVPSYLDIGKLYSILVWDCAQDGDFVNEMFRIFTSFISDEISRFSTDLYYQNPSYLECSYQAGYLLD
jgi:hypothetical protein